MQCFDGVDELLGFIWRPVLRRCTRGDGEQRQIVGERTCGLAAVLRLEFCQHGFRPRDHRRRQAGERSLVILDEIGRGTATFDGLSIAWAAIEHLHETNRCRALFATHFHELTALSQKLPRLHNATVRVKEWHGEVVFLHEVVPGAADRSYGIQVAKLAGLPASVIERAKVVLAMLEADDRSAPPGFSDLPLFAAPAKPVTADPRQTALDTLVAALAAIHPDEMSPREALDALYALKQKAPN